MAGILANHMSSTHVLRAILGPTRRRVNANSLPREDHAAEEGVETGVREAEPSKEASLRAHLARLVSGTLGLRVGKRDRDLAQPIPS